MPLSRQLVVASLKGLARQCLREQADLLLNRALQRKLRREEGLTERRIRLLKSRIDRELAAHAAELGVSTDPSEE